MPACCAKNCHNRSEQGFRLFRFPSDQKRKEIWIKQCNRIPTKSSRLCEYHFDNLQFENRRQDGWRKLKPNAIPTIFIKESTKVLQDESFSSTIILSRENVIEEINVQHNCQPVFIGTGTQTDIDNNVAIFKTAQFSDEDVIKQANEIKSLKKELAYARQKNNRLILKLKREKLLTLKFKKDMKIYKTLTKKYATMLQKI